MSRGQIEHSEYAHFDSEHDALVYMRELVAEFNGVLVSARDGRYYCDRTQYNVAVSALD